MSTAKERVRKRTIEILDEMSVRNTEKMSEISYKTAIIYIYHGNTYMGETLQDKWINHENWRWDNENFKYPVEPKNKEPIIYDFERKERKMETAKEWMKKNRNMTHPDREFIGCMEEYAKYVLEDFKKDARNRVISVIENDMKTKPEHEMTRQERIEHYRKEIESLRLSISGNKIMTISNPENKNEYNKIIIECKTEIIELELKIRTIESAKWWEFWK